MPEPVLTKIRIREGIWEGVLSGAEHAPLLMVTHLEEQIVGVQVAPDGPNWRVNVPIPPRMIADGVQTFLIRDAKSGETLTSFAIAAGEPLSEDLRAEVNLLRAELDLLKRAFRRHCVETEA